MPAFMSDDYLLTNDTAKKVYNKIKDLPIFDYHCHLSPEEILEDKTFYNLTELWLLGDHYKWRVMRNFGVEERLVTGDAPAYDKFFAFASALPSFIGNPVYHWAHLELKKYFGITTPLSAKTAKEIWDKTEKMMANGSFSARKLIAGSNVDTVGTTDDPTSPLKAHEAIAKAGLTFSVIPSYRPDNAINIEKPVFAEYLGKLEQASGIKTSSFDGLVAALENRLDYFVAHGCVATDVSFTDFPKGSGDEKKADKALKDVLAGKKITKEEEDEFKYCILKKLGIMFAQKKLVMQVHTGVLRNQNTTRFKAIGADCGIDSVGNALDIEAGGKLFDDIEKSYGLPKTIVYTLNPNSYYPLATMIGDFAGQIGGKLQLGAAWWFMDHRDGIREQLKIFADTAGLGLFNGMLTDSRSFVSYARHDYFRRIFCSVIGEWAEAGEYPDDMEGLVTLAGNVAFYNAKKFFTR